MSLVTTVTLTIGFAIAKQLVSTWIGDGVQSQVSQDLLDLCRDGLNEWSTNKSERKQIEQVAQQVVAGMTPLWENECRRLDNGARSAIVLALGNAIANSRLDASVLILNRLDAVRLATWLGEQRREQTAGFAPDELVVYQRLLTETSRLIVYMADQIAGYGPLVDHHTLLALDDVLGYLARLTAGQDEANGKFERIYLQRLPVELKRFDPIGFAYADDSLRQQDLSDAYDGLRLTYDEGSAAVAPTPDGMPAARFAGKSGRLAQANPLPPQSGTIHEIVRESSRLVIQGQPGSGKSTLLRLLALRISQDSVETDADGRTPSRGIIPFFLRLRSFKQSGLPNPRDWPALNAPKLALEPPPGWMHELMESGRAIVLIDGIDEVAREQRSQMLTDLKDLVATYPLARYVITSRPAALKNWPEWLAWIRKAGFAGASVQELEPEQVSAFIDQWHSALLNQTAPEDEKAAVRPLPIALKQLMRQRLPLRRLARNPLLCTMICALHREHPNNLPQNRVQLYQDCVEMLLYKRDTERSVGSLADYPPLTHTHEMVVLGEYAHHLLINGASEESLDEAVTFFNRLLESVNMQEWNGEKLCDYFLMRTGLLIAPAEGQIAFAHRTFQEYLAARVIIRKNDMGFLLDKASDDQWRETFLLVVAIPDISEKQSTAIFRGLLKKAGELTGRRNRHELILLAVACMESPIYLSAALRHEILAEAAGIIPPRNQSEIALLAKAGDPIVDLLRINLQQSFAKMARCVETLAEIGSEYALGAIADYCASPVYVSAEAEPLRREIGAAIWRFDAERFCRRVIGGAPMLDLSST